MPLARVVSFSGGDAAAIGRSFARAAETECFLGITQLNQGAYQAAPAEQQRSNYRVQLPDVRYSLQFDANPERHHARFAKLEKSALMPQDSLAGVFGFGQQLNRLMLGEGKPRCPECGADLSLPQIQDLLSDAALQTGVVAAAVDASAAPAGLDVRTFLDVIGCVFIAVHEHLLSVEDETAQTYLDLSCEQFSAEGFKAVLISASLPLNSAGAYERFSSRVQQELSGGTEVFLLHFLSRHAAPRLLARLYPHPYCEVCARAYQNVTEAALGLRGQAACPRCRGAQYLEGGFCPACRGTGLDQALLIWQLADVPLAGFKDLSVQDLHDLCSGRQGREWRELERSCALLIRLGFGDHPLGHRLGQFSTGESMRMKLGLLLLSGLSDCLLFFDFFFSFFPKEEGKNYLQMLQQAAEQGNTCIVIDDAAWVEQGCDCVVRADAGHLYLSAPPPAAESCVPLSPAKGEFRLLSVPGFGEVPLPPGALIAVRGSSGSGKSVFLGELAQQAEQKQMFERVSVLSSASFSKSSTLAAAIGVNEEIARFFAASLAARTKGLSCDDFLYSRSKYRCQSCSGMGIISYESSAAGSRPQNFHCPVCEGRGFDPILLRIRIRDRNISDVLNMTPSQALSFFSGMPEIYRKVEALETAGLQGKTLGIAVSRLGAGELQRLSLALQLLKSRRRPSLFCIDRPFAGMPAAEVEECLRFWRSAPAAKDSIVCADNSCLLAQTADLVFTVRLNDRRTCSRSLELQVPG